MFRHQTLCRPHDEFKMGDVIAFLGTDHEKLILVGRWSVQAIASIKHEYLERGDAMIEDEMFHRCARPRFDLLQAFRTIDYMRDWLPIRREQCAKVGSRKSRWSRSSARRIAIRFRRWPSGTGSASRRSTLGASVSAACRRPMSGA